MRKTRRKSNPEERIVSGIKRRISKCLTSESSKLKKADPSLGRNEADDIIEGVTKSILHKGWF